jgi:hypothetical protein
MDERLRTCNGWAKRLGIDAQRLKHALEAQAEQDPTHRAVLLPSRQAHRTPRTLWRQASVEALLMRRADEAQGNGGFAAAIVYIPAEAARPMELVAVFHDQALVAELQQLAVVHHTQGRTHVIPAGAQRVLADLEALRRQRSAERPSAEPSKPEAPGPSTLAAKPRGSES